MTVGTALLFLMLVAMFGIVLVLIGALQDARRVIVNLSGRLVESRADVYRLEGLVADAQREVWDRGVAAQRARLEA